MVPRCVVANTSWLGAVITWLSWGDTEVLEMESV